MNMIKTTAFAVTALAMGFVADAHAGVITYDLQDSTDNRNGPGGFFQRGDDGLTPLNFAAQGADAKLTYDRDAGTVQISGQVFDNRVNGLVPFELNYSDVVQNGDTLTLNDMGAVGSFGGADVGGKGFNLTLGDEIRGDGWLVVAGTSQHFGDFHFGGTATPGAGTPTGQVPVPSPLTLIAAMALFFGVWRRRRSVAA
jgi:hypothetical protein